MKYKELTKNNLFEVEKHFSEQITDTTKKLKTKKSNAISTKQTYHKEIKLQQ